MPRAPDLYVRFLSSGAISRRPFFEMGQKGAQFLRVSSEFLCSQYFLVLSEHELLLREKHQQSWGTRVLVPMYQNSGALSRWPTDFLFQQTWALETVLFLFFTFI